MAAPMPSEAPVTTATFPFNSIIELLLAAALVSIMQSQTYAQREVPQGPPQSRPGRCQRRR